MHMATLAAEVAAWQRRMLVLRKPAAARAGPSAGTDSVAGDALGADPGLHVKPQLGQGNDSFLSTVRLNSRRSKRAPRAAWASARNALISNPPESYDVY